MFLGYWCVLGDIHKCDFRVGPGPSSQGRKFRVVPSPDCIHKCDCRVALVPAVQADSLGSFPLQVAFKSVAVGWALGPAVEADCPRVVPGLSA